MTTLSGSSVLVQGIEMGFVAVPLHEIHLACDLANGVFKVGVRPSLPVRGITFLLGNDIAGGKVMPVLEILERPEILQPDVLAQDFPEVFPVCVVTRAQARSLGEAVVLSDTLFATELNGQTVSPVFPQSAAEPSVQPKVQCDPSTKETPRLPMVRSNLIAAQKEDITLAKCFAAALAPESAKNKEIDYFMENDLLMRRWKSRVDLDNGRSNVSQIVVPTQYRQSVLSLAHEHLWSGHLGITKTYDRVLRQFFWPGLKRDVSLFCRTCHVCQVTGKPNQVIKPAPLHPVPAMGEPFEHVLVDCVGPLPKTKSGNQFLLTIMCVATRYPEAIPLRSITAKAVVRALIKFFSTFGLPKIVQTDQGTNFLSGIFEQVLTSLSIAHRVSSAYHPESQGALERWHQTFKSVLRKYIMDSGREWDDGVPLALFAVREIVQESLGFSPAELVFGHTVRGPLRVLKDQLTGEGSPTQRNVLTYVSRFRERLHEACSIAKESLSVAQQGMKRQFDKKALPRSLQTGDLVLVLLPIPGTSMSARFSGPYTIDRRLSDTDYVVRTPDRRRKTRVCHINMLKKYYTRGDVQPETRSVPLVATVAVSAVSPNTANDEDGLSLRNAQQQTPRLSNSEMLLKLPSLMCHLSREQEADLLCLISEFPCLFGDVPTRTTVLEHDIDVGESRPIKQHPYRVNAYNRSLMKKEVDYLLENNFARPSSSPWSSPCLLVPKPDGTVRFCTDYRKVNHVTVPDSFPMPRVDDCVDTIGSARYVTKLDLLKGYWQVPLSPRASAISAFATPDNFAQYFVMAFGMRNAPATFQRLVSSVFSGVPNCTAYLDDVVIHSSEWTAHVDSLRTVFQRLADASLTLNLAKCEFGKATVTYLGKQVGGGQVRPLEEKIAAITSFPVPTTRRELRRFLGMTGYYRGFCRNFSSVVAPMTDLISPLVKFVWSDMCQIAFECCKALLCNAPVLSAPDFNKSFSIEVDASSIAAGAVLTQMDSEGLVHPVGFFSKKFNSAQMRYSTIEQETLALLLALQFFEVYVGSSAEPVMVYTDHNPLVFLHRMHNHNQRLMRWSLIITNYNLVIHHKKGTENVFADALSRV
uniref:Gypsy retrotransposon integrase-like protein 1 n=1 Tax=Gasterosteus aculeatus aculeatus TaxID=481459 RepID=A0AAQ4PM80_GASAC